MSFVSKCFCEFGKRTFIEITGGIVPTTPGSICEALIICFDNYCVCIASLFLIFC